MKLHSKSQKGVLIFLLKNKISFKIKTSVNVVFLFFIVCYTTDFQSQENQKDACFHIYTTLSFQNKENSTKALATAQQLQNCININKKKSNHQQDYLLEIAVAFKKNSNVDEALHSFELLLKDGNLKPLNALTIYKEVADIYYQKYDMKNHKLYTMRQLKLALEVKDTSFIANAYDNLGFDYRFESKTDSADFYYKKAMNLSLLIHDSLQFNKIKFSYASMLYSMNKPFEALKKFNEIEKYLVKIKETSLLSDTYFFLAIVYKKIGRLDESLAYYKKVIPLYTNDNRFDRLPKLYSNIGILYKSMGYKEKALENYLKSLKLTKEFDEILKGGNLSLIGGIYIDLKKFDEGYKYLHKAIKICEKIGYNSRAAEGYANLARYFADRPNKNKNSDYDSLIYYSKKSLKAYEDLNNKQGQMDAYFSLSGVYALKKEFKTAEKYLQTGIQLANDINTSGVKSTSLFYQAEFYRNKKEYKKADEYNVLYQEQQDVNFKTELTEKLDENLAYYDYLLKVKQDSLQHDYQLNFQKAIITEKDTILKKQSFIIFTIVCVVFILIVLSYYVIKRNKQLNIAKQEIDEQKHQVEKQRDDLKIANKILKNTQNKLLEKEKLAAIGILSQNLAHELKNPLHFVKGSSLAIGKKIENSEFNTDKSMLPLLKGIQDGVSRMSAVIDSLQRINNEKATSEIIDIHPIIQDSFAKLIENRGVDIEFINLVPKSTFLKIDVFTFLIIINNILTNAIESIANKGTITVISKSMHQNLILQIIDTGVGIDKEHLKTIFEPFYSTKKEVSLVGTGLFQTYNLLRDCGGSIKIKSDVEKGTIVSLYFKNNINE